MEGSLDEGCRAVGSEDDGPEMRIVFWKGKGDGDDRMR